MSGGLPRWIAVAIAVLAIAAIVTGAREAARPPVAVPAAHFDTAFVRANGFMMDSLRLGRSDAVPSPHPARKVRPVSPSQPAARDTLTTHDSLPLRYSPRGCMPE